MSAARTVASLRTALGLAWSAHPLALVGYVAAGVGAGVVPVAVAWLTKIALDAVAAGRGGGDVWVAGVALAAGGWCFAALPALQRYLDGALGRAVSVEAKDRLYRRVVGIPLIGALEVPEFRDRLRMAEEASRSAPGAVVAAAVGFGQAAVSLVGLVAAVALIAPAVAGVLVLSVTPALFAEIRLSRARAAMLWGVSPAQRREVFFAMLLTDLAAAKEIRLFGSGPLFRRRMLAELATSNAAEQRFERREARTQIGLATVSAAVAGVAVVSILLTAAGGRAGAGDVAAVLVAVGGVQGALATVVQHVAAGHHAGVLLEHYRALTTPSVGRDSDGGPDRPVEVGVDGGADRRVDGGAGRRVGGGAPGRGLELVDVWFRYGDEQPWVLRGITATLAPGEAVALVGENGSGKSTLVKLLCRFYDPSRGSIRWDGVDLRDLPLDEVRSRIGAVFQDFMSYELTAAENVALGDVDGREDLDLDPTRIEAAARAAEVHGMLSALPHGYRTLLSRTFVDESDDGAEGVLLSGGQWQRVALARALARGQRDLLILDEPSAGLDAEAEHRIHAAVRDHRRGRTSVLVSHRLNTVRDADRILVLAAGRVVESGDHAALMAADGRYARLFRMQAAGYETVPAP